MTSPEQLLSQLRWRYATKVFDPSKKIPPQDINAIEESLVLTASSFGLQPWHFFVITNQEMKESLLPHSWNQPQVVDCSHLIVLAAKTTITEEDINTYIERIRAIQGNENERLSNYKGMISGILFKDSFDIAGWAQKQTYIALGNLLTTAAVLGIDACPMEGFIQEEYDKILQLEEKQLTTSLVCPLGYRSEEDKYATLPKVRFLKEKTVTQIT